MCGMHTRNTQLAQSLNGKVTAIAVTKVSRSYASSAFHCNLLLEYYTCGHTLLLAEATELEEKLTFIPSAS